MWDQSIYFLKLMLDQTGAAHFWWGNLVMMAIGATMVYLAIAKHYEPFLLVGIGTAISRNDRCVTLVGSFRPSPALLSLRL